VDDNNFILKMCCANLHSPKGLLGTT